MRNHKEDALLELTDDEFWAFAEFADDCWQAVLNDVEQQSRFLADERTRPDMVVVRHLLNWHTANHIFGDEIIAGLTRYLLGVPWPALVDLAARADQAITDNACELFAGIADDADHAPDRADLASWPILKGIKP